MAKPQPGLLARSRWLSADFKSLSLFRILFGIFLACTCYQQLLFFSDIYSDEGVLPRSYLLSGWDGTPGVLSLLMVSNLPLYLWLFKIIYVLAIAAFAVGYRTRLANIVLIAASVSMSWRNPLAYSLVPCLIDALLIWTSFLPMNRYWSIDAALEPDQDRARAHPVIPFVALKLQLVSLYLFSGIYKLCSEPWIKGYGAMYASQDSVYGAPQGQWLVEHAPHFITGVNYAVVLFQIGFMFLVFSPYLNNVTRAVALIGAVVMHLTFIFLMHVGLFQELCLCSLVLLVPDEWWAFLSSKRMRRLNKLRAFNVSRRWLNSMRDILISKPQTPPGAVAQSFCALLSVLMLAANIIQIPLFDGHRSAWARQTLDVASFFQVKENWRLYTPNAERNEYRLLSRVTMREDGRAVDYVDKLPYDPNGIDIFANKDKYNFWQHYFLALYQNKRVGERNALAEYVCRMMNKDEFKVSNVKMNFVLTRHSMRGTGDATQEHMMLANATCATTPNSSNKVGEY